MKQNKKMLMIIGGIIAIIIALGGFFLVSNNDDIEDGNGGSEVSDKIDEETDIDIDHEADLEKDPEIEEDESIDTKGDEETKPTQPDKDKDVKPTQPEKDKNTNGKPTQPEGDKGTETKPTQPEDSKDEDVETEMKKVSDLYTQLVDSELGGRAMEDTTADALTLYGLSTDLVTDYTLQITMMSPGIDEIFIAKVVEGKSDEVKKLLEERVQVLSDEKAFYPEDEEAVDGAKIFTNGDYIMLYVVGDPEASPKAEVIFNNFTN